MRIVLDDANGLFHHPATPELVKMLPFLTGDRKYFGKEKFLRFDPSKHNIAVIQRHFPGASVEDNRNSVLFEERKLEPLPFNFKTKPYPHQQEAFDRAVSKDHFGLFMEQGTGKTKVAIDLAAKRFCDREISGLIVLAPMGVHRQWALSQLQIHCPVPFEVHVWPLGNPKHTMFKLDGLFAPNPDKLKVFCINWDGMKTGNGMQACKSFMRIHGGRIMVVADESHNIKNVRSSRNKVAREIFGKAKHRMILTGTPIAKDLTDEWAQLYFLDESILGIRFITYFRNEYCIMGGFEGKVVVGHKNQERFRSKVDPYTFRVTREQIGLLPPRFTPWMFDLSPEQKRIIKEMKNLLLAQIEDGTIVNAAHAATAVMKMQQVSNGFIIDDDRNVRTLIPDDENPRIIALKEVLEARPGKIIVWCRFKEDIRTISRAIPESLVVYSGDQTQKERAQSVEEWLDPDGPRIFLANPQVGGTGLNLQGACFTDVFYSNSDNAIERWQAMARIDRIGSTNSVEHIDLIGTGSFDRKILGRHNNKKSISEMAIGDFAAWLNRDDDSVEDFSSEQGEMSSEYNATNDEFDGGN